MAHELEMNTNGTAKMFFTGTTPWHGLGTRLQKPPTVAEGIQAAGLDWTVRLDALQTADGRMTDHNATVRSTDNQVLGVVGPQYRPLQNVDAFQWFQPFLDAGAASLHTAGSLREGRRVWVLARLSGGPLEIAAGDVVERFILLSNSHDGTLAVRVGFTPIRVVCANTLAMAHGSDASKLIRIKHTESCQANLAAVRSVMDAANSQFEATADQYRKLARAGVSRADVKKYIRQVFEVKDDAETSTRLANMMADVLRLCEGGRGNATPAVRGTLWAAYNGVTEFLGTAAGRNQDSRLNSLWFGESANANRRALELALAMAA